MREIETINALKEIRPLITKQTYKTIKGQIKAGDLEGAKKGIERIKNGLLVH